ncbi:MAG: hypothetical protein AAGA90_05895 [Actinomycetota bacterium]
MPVISPERNPVDVEPIDRDITPNAASETTAPTRQRAAVVLVTIMAVFGPIVGLVLGRASAGNPSIGAPERELDAVAQTVDPTSPTPARAIDVDVALDGLDRRLTSQDGRWEVWAEPLADGATIYAPGGRATTTFVVRDKLDGSTRSFTFDRNLEPEAFSSDGATLFTIDHRPALDPEIYRVTAVDLDERVIREVIGPNKSPLIEEMRGEGRQQVWAPDDGQLYTLYVRQLHVHPELGSVPHDDHANGDPTDAFIHVLDVDNEWALCLELPAGFGLGPDGTTDIFIDDGGDTITVVDHTIGQRIDVAVERNGRTSTYEIGPAQSVET